MYTVGGNNRDHVERHVISVKNYRHHQNFVKMTFEMNMLHTSYIFDLAKLEIIFGR